MITCTIFIIYLCKSKSFTTKYKIFLIFWITSHSCVFFHACMHVTCVPDHVSNMVPEHTHMCLCMHPGMNTPWCVHACMLHVLYMEISGVEPLTLTMQKWCSTNWAKSPLYTTHIMVCGVITWYAVRQRFELWVGLETLLWLSRPAH